MSASSFLPLFDLTIDLRGPERSVEVVGRRPNWLEQDVDACRGTPSDHDHCSGRISPCTRHGVLMIQQSDLTGGAAGAFRQSFTFQKNTSAAT